MSVLKFKHNKQEYTSKPFDFKAMCLINEKHNDVSIKGPIMRCVDAVDYLFEGTEGEGIIAELSPGVHSNLCLEAWDTYIKELTAKNE